MKTPEEFRITKGIMASNKDYKNNGAFSIPFLGRDLFVICSDGEGWEHVSVSLKNRCPNWEEMCFIKDLFWDENEAVIQFHPPKNKYVNNHKYCLHLWRPINEEIKIPNTYLVGII